MRELILPSVSQIRLFFKPNNSKKISSQRARMKAEGLRMKKGTKPFFILHPSAFILAHRKDCTIVCE
jgi:hypothetical protein